MSLLVPVAMFLWIPVVFVLFARMPAERAVVYGRIGTHTVEFGTLASWAVDVLNALTGNLDRPGGALFPLPAHSAAGDRRAVNAVDGAFSPTAEESSARARVSPESNDATVTQFVSPKHRKAS